MKGISSDVTALAAVLGSAAVAGVVTLALAGSDSVEVVHECLVTEVETAPRVVVALNSGYKAVLVTPEPRARATEVCEKIFFAQSHDDEHVEHTRAELMRAQEGLERARLRIREGLELKERLEFTDRLHLLDRLDLTERLERTERPERVERVRRRVRDQSDEIRHELGTTRVVVDGVAIELEGLGELLDLELEGLGEALELEFGGRMHLTGAMERSAEELERSAEEMQRSADEMERTEEEMERAEEEMNRVDEELKRLIDELRRKRRRRGGGGG
jgi:hypothetical protein